MARLLDCKINYENYLISENTIHTEPQLFYFRRIQVILMGVIAISALENSAKRTEIFEAQLNPQSLIVKSELLQRQPLKAIIRPTSRQRPTTKPAWQGRSISSPPELEEL